MWNETEIERNNITFKIYHNLSTDKNEKKSIYDIINRWSEDVEGEGEVLNYITDFEESLVNYINNLELGSDCVAFTTEQWETAILIAFGIDIFDDDEEKFLTWFNDKFPVEYCETKQGRRKIKAELMKIKNENEN